MSIVNRFLPAVVIPFLVTSCGGGGSGGGNGGNNTAGLTSLSVSTNANANGAIVPSSATVTEGGTTSFTIQADTGFVIASVSGCGGTLVGSTYTTAPVINDCEVTASFAPQNSTSLSQSTYVKASNTGAGDSFGDGVALNEDGTVMVVGAPAEQSANGSQDDNSRSNGAVYVYTNNGTSWSQHSYIKPSTLVPAGSPYPRQDFGDSVSINDDGTTIAVATPGEEQTSNESGGVYIFNLENSVWVEEDLLKVTNADQYTQSPGKNNTGVALDGAGTTLVVAEFGDSSITNAINGDETDTSAAVAGAAHVFFKDNGSWSRQAYLKGSTVQAGDQFGSSIAISGDGNTIAIGARESSVTNPESGSVYIFVREAGVWAEQQRIQPTTPDINLFGFSVSLNHSGDMLAVGVPTEGSGGSGIGTDPTLLPGTKIGSGAAYIFERNGTVWTEQEFIKASVTDINDQFGRSVSLNSAGDKLAVSAIGESGNSAGINGDPNNNLANLSGAAYLFSRAGSTWSQDAYLKAGNPVDFINFGGSVSISGNGEVIAVGNKQDASNATGINGDETNTDAFGSGSVTVFE